MSRRASSGIRVPLNALHPGRRSVHHVGRLAARPSRCREGHRGFFSAESGTAGHCRGSDEFVGHDRGAHAGTSRLFRHLPLRTAFHQHFVTEYMDLIYLEHPHSADSGARRFGKPAVRPPGGSLSERRVDHFPSGASTMRMSPTTATRATTAGGLGCSPRKQASTRASG